MRILVVGNDLMFFAGFFNLSSPEKDKVWAFDEDSDEHLIYQNTNANEFFEVLKGFITDEINAGKQNIVVDVEYLASLV